MVVRRGGGGGGGERQWAGVYLLSSVLGLEGWCVKAAIGEGDCAPTSVRVGGESPTPHLAQPRARRSTSGVTSHDAGGAESLFFRQ